MRFKEFTLRDDGNLRVKTNAGEFVYPADKFKDVASLEKEIIKKTVNRDLKQQRKTARINKLKQTLKNSGAKEVPDARN